MAKSDLAILLIASVRKALKDGIKHYDSGGKSLTTEKEILTALQNGPVTLEYPDKTKNTAGQ
jgi:hypothetical protein